MQKTNLKEESENYFAKENQLSNLMCYESYKREVLEEIHVKLNEVNP